MTGPESRYRRLLALYPREFRREYGEEMLSVLLADPRPGAGQALDLVRAALACRLRQPFAAGRDWRRAAGVAQVSGAMLLLAVALRRLATGAAAPDFRPDAVLVLRVVGWAVVLAAAVLGWRLLAAGGAAGGLAGEIASPARYYLETPATVLSASWLVTAAVVVLVAGLVAQRGGLLRAWPAREPAVWRRVVAWAAPVLVTVPLVTAGFGGFIEHNMRHPESVRLLGPVQWAALVVIPAVTFWVVAELNRRFEAARAVSSGRGSDK